jgi:hypothetical protein
MRNASIWTAAVLSAALVTVAGPAGEASAAPRPSFLVPRNGAAVGARF